MAKKQLIVEGKNDQHVVFAIRDKFKLPKSFDVIYPNDEKDDSGGVKKMRKYLQGLPIRLKEGNIDVLGIVIDADDEPSSQWQSIKDVFSRFSYILPSLPIKGGTIVDHPNKNTDFPLKIGIWFMPDNQLRRGALENFLIELIHDKDELIGIAKSAVSDAKTLVDESRRFKEKDEFKALIHSWLALQNSPGKPYGQAVTANYFNKNAELAKTFAAWLDKLFNK